MRRGKATKKGSQEVRATKLSKNKIKIIKYNKINKAKKIKAGISQIKNHEMMEIGTAMKTKKQEEDNNSNRLRIRESAEKFE
jgi:hypothetical protein